MERAEVLDLMGTLKLCGMRSAYDEIMGVAIKRQLKPFRIVGDLLQAEISEKQARSSKYQLIVAKLPLAKDIEDFDFADTPVNEPLIRDLAAGAFVADQRDVVLVGGTGTGKSHLAIAIARYRSEFPRRDCLRKLAIGSHRRNMAAAYRRRMGVRSSRTVRRRHAGDRRQQQPRRTLARALSQ